MCRRSHAHVTTASSTRIRAVPRMPVSQDSCHSRLCHAQSRTRNRTARCRCRSRRCRPLVACTRCWTPGPPAPRWTMCRHSLPRPLSCYVTGASCVPSVAVSGNPVCFQPQMNPPSPYVRAALLPRQRSRLPTQTWEPSPVHVISTFISDNPVHVIPTFLPSNPLTGRTDRSHTSDACAFY